MSKLKIGEHWFEIDDNSYFNRSMKGYVNATSLRGFIQDLWLKIDDGNPKYCYKDGDYYSWLLLNVNWLALTIEHKYLRYNPEADEKQVSINGAINFFSSHVDFSGIDISPLRQCLELRNSLIHLGAITKIRNENDDFVEEVCRKGNVQLAKTTIEKATEILEKPDPPTSVKATVDGVEGVLIMSDIQIFGYEDGS